MQETQMDKYGQPTALGLSGGAINPVALLFALLIVLCSSCSLLSDSSHVRTRVASPRMTGSMATSLSFSLPFDWTKKKISIRPAENWGLFKERDAIIIHTTDNSPITVFDLYGKTVYSGPSPAFLRLSCGHYFVECKGDRNQFAVLPNAYVGASFMGAGAVTNVPWGDLQKQLQMAVQWVRSGKGGLANVRPQSNRWTWSSMDAIVDANAGRKIIATVGGKIPSWIQPSQLVAVYTNFVAALAQRYKGKLAAIEIWNEPAQDKLYNDANWRRILTQLTTGSTAVVRAIDPTIQIIGPSWQNAWSFALTANLAQLGAAWDILTWHDYFGYGMPPDKDTIGGDGNTVPSVPNRISGYRQAAGGFSGPICINELGFWGDSALGLSYGRPSINHAPLSDWSTTMARTVKTTIMYRAGGATCLMPQCLVNGCGFKIDFSSALGGWEYGNRGPCPKTSALLMTCYWINGAKFVGYEHNGTLWKAHWLRHDQPMTFVWSEEGHTNPLGRITARVTDIYGNPAVATEITATPVIVWGVK
jgi:hypothetical protein